MKVYLLIETYVWKHKATRILGVFRTKKSAVNYYESPKAYKDEVSYKNYGTPEKRDKFLRNLTGSNGYWKSTFEYDDVCYAISIEEQEVLN